MDTSSTEVASPDQQPSQSISELISKGWTQKAEGKYDEAEASFRKALSLDSQSVEANYGIALTLKAQDRRQESIQGFEKVIELVDSRVEDRTRGEMLKRLSQAHINQLRSGDWGLEKEMWKRK
ncbi:MAG: tetratricopeptide repeat protein [Anaerolineales bacterium]